MNYKRNSPISVSSHSFRLFRFFDLSNRRFKFILFSLQQRNLIGTKIKKKRRAERSFATEE
jgi:hypothetical protein